MRQGGILNTLIISAMFLFGQQQNVKTDVSPIPGVDPLTWSLVIEKASMIKKPGDDLDLSAVIAALILLELDHDTPSTLNPEIRALANNGKTGGAWDKDLNKRLLAVYYKAKKEADARDKRLHDDLQKQISDLRREVEELKKNHAGSQ